MSDIGKLERETQNRVIAETLSDMDAEIAALEGKLVKARQVKQGMMSVLLTGKVRLVQRSDLTGFTQNHMYQEFMFAHKLWLTVVMMKPVRSLHEMMFERVV